MVTAMDPRLRVAIIAVASLPVVIMAVAIGVRLVPIIFAAVVESVVRSVVGA